MSDFSQAWNLSRQRFVDEIKDLSDEQLRWRLFPTAHSIGEMAIHLAGVEVLFGSQLAKTELDEFGTQLRRSATEGVVNDLPFPFDNDSIDGELVNRSLAYARALWGPLIESAAPDIRNIELVSALGPIITGEGAFARLSFHSGYHQGQAYLIKSAPDFPRS